MEFLVSEKLLKYSKISQPIKEFANVCLFINVLAQAKGAIKGKSEMSSTDRNRERRTKKKKQKLKRLAQEEKAKLKGLGLRNIKLADNIVKANDKSKSKTALDDEKVNQKHLKSSKAFFAKLQEQVQTHVKGISKRKQPVKQLSAKKFKM